MNRLLCIILSCVAAVTAAAQRLPERSPIPEMEALWPLRFELLPPKPDTVSLFIVGDIMSHRAVSKSAEEHGYGSFFKHIEDRIARADLAVGNMEFPLAGKPYTGYPAFSGPDGYAQYLSDVGFDIFLTANNHILDKGTAGICRTIEVLERKGLVYTGIAADGQADTLLNPLMVHVRGLRIAIVNFTYGTNTGPFDKWPKVNYMRKADILPMLVRARQADLVMVFPHWGTEYRLHHDREPSPPPHLGSGASTSLCRTRRTLKAARSRLSTARCAITSLYGPSTAVRTVCAFTRASSSTGSHSCGLRDC